MVENTIITMRHFRGSRGSRRRNGMPRSSIRSAKYIVVDGPNTEGVGLTAFTIAIGKDNAVLGQTSVTDKDIPVGAKIAQIELFMPKVNLGASTANFIHWSIQRTLVGQAVQNPITAGGDAKRSNIMLTGVLGLGQGQNSSTHVTFKVPTKYQRMQDGMIWNIVNNNFLAVSTTYYFIFKVFM